MGNTEKPNQSEASIWLNAFLGARDEKERGQLHDLFKSTQQSPKAVHEAIEKAKANGFVVGVKVRMLGDPEVGEIVRHNTSSAGFYTGDRYPIVVKFERGTCEYGEESLELV